MPTVHREDGFSFLVYTHDHEPPHVHVFKGGAEAKIALGAADEGPSILDPMKMPAADLRRAFRIVEANQAALSTAWRKHHAEVETPDGR